MIDNLGRGKPVKILHVLAQMPGKTGSGVYYTNVIRGLKAYGWEQRALFARQDGSGFDALEESMQYPVAFQSDKLPFPIPGMSDVMPYESTVYARMDESMLRAWTGAFRQVLERARDKFRPDVLLLHHLWMLTSLAVEVFPDPVKVGVCHNTDLRQAEQNPYLKEKYAANLHRLDGVLALSALQRDRISALFPVDPSKVTTVGGGYDGTLFYPPARRERGGRVRMVYAGKIDRSKGIFELVKAFRMAGEAKPNLHLDIVGTPDLPNARALRALTEGAEDIALHPAMSQRELADFIRSRDIFVLPSYYEGLGLMAIESLGSGLWTVATEIEGLMSLLGEAVGRSGVIEYVKPPRVYDTDKPVEEDLDRFVEELCAKLLLQVEKVERGEAFPEEIWPRIRVHSWDSVVRRIRQSLSELLNRRFAEHT